MAVDLATRLLPGGVMLLLLVACQPVSPATRCANVADCPAGFVCRPDLKVCVATRAGADGGIGADGAGITDGAVDGGVADGGVADGGVADAGVADAGMADSGAVDGGSSDAAAGADGSATGDASCDCTTCTDWNPSIATGGNHSCTTTAQRNVYCWGDNIHGQLGNSNQAAQPNPTLVCHADSSCSVDAALSNTAKLTVGLQHSCALGLGGRVHCWGDNLFGQLGIGGWTQLISTPTPICIPGPWDPDAQTCASGGILIGVRDIAAGSYHTCLLLQDRTVRCFGFNTNGQLGNGHTTTGFQISGVCSTGVWDHAENSCGPGGVLLGEVVELSAGALHTCARLADGSVRCWGNNGTGQLGDGTTQEAQPNPSVVCAAGSFDRQTGLCAGTDAAPLLSVVGLAAGALHTCVLTATGEVMCFGQNRYAQLGNEQVHSDSSTPVHVCPWGPACSPDVIPAAATAIVAGFRHTCVLSTGGAIYCWGVNAVGQLGCGSQGETTCPSSDGCSSSPRGVCATGTWDTQSGACSGAQLVGAIALAGGDQHTCAVLDDHSLRCWGSNNRGELGDGTTSGQSCFSGICRPNAVQTCASGAGAGCEGGNPFSLSCPPD